MSTFISFDWRYLYLFPNQFIEMFQVTKMIAMIKK